METAIPITHSFTEAIEFIEESPITPVERAITDLATSPGWEQLEREIQFEIKRLDDVKYDGESVEQYGFKCLAASLCKSKLEWIINRVRGTESAVRESTK